MKEKLLFDHVPKTAGTSVSSALSRMFGESGTLPEFFNMHSHVINTAGAKRLLAGHLWFGHSEGLAEGWYYCTLIRDPIDRFLSQYWFYRQLGRQHALDSNNAPHADVQVQAATECDIEQYIALDNPAIKLSYTNVQASHFARRLCAYPDVLSRKALTTAAITALEDYDLVGVFENVQGFIDAIAHETGFDPVKIPRLNITFDRMARDEVPANVLEKLQEANQVDLDLHAWAQKRFAEKLRFLQSPEGARARAEAKAARQELYTGVPQLGAATAPAMLEFGTREVEIRGVRCVGKESGTATVKSGESVEVVVECYAGAPIGDVTMGIAVRDKRGELVYGTNSRLLGLEMPIERAGSFRKSLVLQANLGSGGYYVTVALHKGASHLEGCYHWIENASMFTVVGQPTNQFSGLVDLGVQLHQD